MTGQDSTSSVSAADGGRRRFLLGAAGLAATPLLGGVASGAPNERTPQPGRGNPVAAATTVAGRRRIGKLKVSGVGLGCQTMTGTLYGPVTSRKNMVALVRTAADQGVTS